MDTATYRARQAAAMREEELEEHVRGACKALDVIRVHQLRSRGTEAGWVDDVLLGPHGALFRELKTARGRVSPAQESMHVVMRQAGLNVAVWRPADWHSGRILREITAISGRTIDRLRHPPRDRRRHAVDQALPARHLPPLGGPVNTDTWYAENEAMRQRERTYRGLVTPESLPHIADRIERLVRSCRRMTKIEHIGESTRPYRSTTGLTLDTESRGGGVDRGESHISVHLAPGLGGFGVSTGRWESRIQLGEEFERARKWRDGHPGDTVFGRDPEHIKVTIEGGLHDGEWGREDCIQIEELNQHGVMVTDTVLFDADPIREPVRRPYRLDYDPDGAYAAEQLNTEIPDQVRWAVLQDILAGPRKVDDLREDLESEFRALDAKVRPWTRAAEGAPS